MKRGLFTLVISALVAASCTKNNDIVIPEQPFENKTGKVITVTASIGESLTRLALAENTTAGKIEVRWREGDKIYLYGVQGTELVKMDATTVTNIRNDGRTADFNVVITPDFNGDLIGSMAPLLHTKEGKLETAIYDCPVPLSELREIPRYFEVSAVTAMNADEKLASVVFRDPGVLLLLNVKNTHATMKMIREFDIEENWSAPHVFKTGLQPGTDMHEFVEVPTVIDPGEEKTLAVWRAPSQEKIAAGIAKYMAVTLDITETIVPGDYRTSDVAVLLKTRTGALENGKAYELPAMEWNGFCFSNAGGNYMEFVFVLEGSFDMGIVPNTHDVTVSHFFIGKTEVTQAQWKALMGETNNPSVNKGDNLPVENISWNEITAPGGFMEKLNAITSNVNPFATTRIPGLPTEAQWEYAARDKGRADITFAGSTGYDANPVSWYSDNSGNATHQVGGKNPNILCAYDMSGNVSEWCADWYGEYPTTAQDNPRGAVTGTERVIRGGSFKTELSALDVRNRASKSPQSGYDGVGFRVVIGEPAATQQSTGVSNFTGNVF